MRWNWLITIDFLYIISSNFKKYYILFTYYRRLKLDPDLDLGMDVGSLLDNTAARHKISVRPRRKHADSRQRPSSKDER